MRFARMALIGVASLAVATAMQGRALSGPSDIVLPAPHPRPVSIGAEALRPVPQIEGCGSTPISCNTDARGQLIAGDCQSANNTFFDEYVFSGPSQELVNATVRPLSTTYTNAWLGFVSPPSDTALAPMISGGPAATVHYILPVTGTWRFQLGTNDRFAAGDYFFEMTCDDSPPPSPQLACVEQELLCGQQATWELSSQSCITSSDPTRFYASYRVYGAAGDTLSIRLTSTAFDPQFGIFEFDQSAAPLAQSSALNATTDTLNFSVSHNGFYDIVVTSGNAHGTGQYTLSLDCDRSGCIVPIILKQPQDVIVPPASFATLTVEASTLGGVDYEWFDADGAQPNLGGGPKYSTVAITSPHNYYVTVTTPCGTVRSRTVNVRPATVEPPPPQPRHHAVKH